MDAKSPRACATPNFTTRWMRRTQDIDSEMTQISYAIDHDRESQGDGDGGSSQQPSS